jgi:hypothetical protein
MEQPKLVKCEHLTDQISKEYTNNLEDNGVVDIMVDSDIHLKINPIKLVGKWNLDIGAQLSWDSFRRILTILTNFKNWIHTINSQL